MPFSFCKCLCVLCESVCARVCVHVYGWVCLCVNQCVCVCRYVPAMCVHVRQLWVLGLWSESVLLGFCAKSRLANQVVAGSQLSPSLHTQSYNCPPPCPRFSHRPWIDWCQVFLLIKTSATELAWLDPLSEQRLAWASQMWESWFWTATPGFFISKVGKDISGLEGAVRLFLEDLDSVLSNRMAALNWFELLFQGI